MYPPDLSRGTITFWYDPIGLRQLAVLGTPSQHIFFRSFGFSQDGALTGYDAIEIAAHVSARNTIWLRLTLQDNAHNRSFTIETNPFAIPRGGFAVGFQWDGTGLTWTGTSYVSGSENNSPNSLNAGQSMVGTNLLELPPALETDSSGNGTEDVYYAGYWFNITYGRYFPPGSSELDSSFASSLNGGKEFQISQLWIGPYLDLGSNWSRFFGSNDAPRNLGRDGSSPTGGTKPYIYLPYGRERLGQSTGQLKGFSDAFGPASVTTPGIADGSNIFDATGIPVDGSYQAEGLHFGAVSALGNRSPMGQNGDPKSGFGARGMMSFWLQPPVFGRIQTVTFTIFECAASDNSSYFQILSIGNGTAWHVELNVKSPFMASSEVFSVSSPDIAIIGFQPVVVLIQWDFTTTSWTAEVQVNATNVRFRGNSWSANNFGYGRAATIMGVNEIIQTPFLEIPGGTYTLGRGASFNSEFQLSHFWLTLDDAPLRIIRDVDKFFNTNAVALSPLDLNLNGTGPNSHIPFLYFPYSGRDHPGLSTGLARGPFTTITPRDFQGADAPIPRGIDGSFGTLVFWYDPIGLRRGSASKHVIYACLNNASFNQSYLTVVAQVDRGDPTQFWITVTVNSGPGRRLYAMTLPEMSFPRGGAAFGFEWDCTTSTWTSAIYVNGTQVHADRGSSPYGSTGPIDTGIIFQQTLPESNTNAALFCGYFLNGGADRRGHLTGGRSTPISDLSCAECQLSQFWLAPQQKVGLDRNWSKFFGGVNNDAPADLGSDGSTPTRIPPFHYFRGAAAQVGVSSGAFSGLTQTIGTGTATDATGIPANGLYQAVGVHFPDRLVLSQASPLTSTVQSDYVPTGFVFFHNPLTIASPLLANPPTGAAGTILTHFNIRPTDPTNTTGSENLAVFVNRSDRENAYFALIVNWASTSFRFTLKVRAPFMGDGDVFELTRNSITVPSINRSDPPVIPFYMISGAQTGTTNPVGLGLQWNFTGTTWSATFFLNGIADTTTTHTYRQAATDPVLEIADGFYTFGPGVPSGISIDPWDNDQGMISAYNLRHFWLSFDDTVDVVENWHRFFWTDSFTPIDIGTDGSEFTGSKPFLYLPYDTRNGHAGERTGTARGPFTQPQGPVFNAVVWPYPNEPQLYDGRTARTGRIRFWIDPIVLRDGYPGGAAGTIIPVFTSETQFTNTATVNLEGCGLRVWLTGNSAADPNTFKVAFRVIELNQTNPYLRIQSNRIDVPTGGIGIGITWNMTGRTATITVRGTDQTDATTLVSNTGALPFSPNALFETPDTIYMLNFENSNNASSNILALTMGGGFALEYINSFGTFQLSQFWLQTGVEIDFTSNWSKFFGTSDAPANLGIDGRAPGYGTPIIYLPGDTSNLGINTGRLGGAINQGYANQNTTPIGTSDMADATGIPANGRYQAVGIKFTGSDSFSVTPNIGLVHTGPLEQINQSEGLRFSSGCFYTVTSPLLRGSSSQPITYVVNM